MDMVIIESDDHLRVALTGRLDAEGVTKIEPAFFATVVPRARPTVLDLGQLTFMALSGARMLIAIARALAAKGARLTMYNAAPDVLEGVEVTGLRDIAPVTGTEAEAVALAKG